jgi:hypothetical protein
MVKPFQMHVIWPLLSRLSFASHEMGVGLYSQPSILQTAFARSRSKPVYLPSSPT